MSDEITITVLPDGTIKMETDAIGMPVHASAEAFLREVQSLAGGKVTIDRKQAAAHAHNHAHARNEH